jgi:hypothetical protein
MASCRGEDGSAGTQPAQPARLQHHRRGRRDGEGPGRVTVLYPEFLPQPQHGGGGRQVAGQTSEWRSELLPRRGLAADLILKMIKKAKISRVRVPLND